MSAKTFGSNGKNISENIVKLKLEQNIKSLLQGFPNGVNWWGDSLRKMPKSCMKMTKTTFLCQNSGGTWGSKPIFQVLRGIPPH